MKSKTAWFTVVAAAIFVVLVLNYLGVPFDGASDAFAQMREALATVPCAHGVLVVDMEQGKKVNRREVWVCGESGTKHERLADGTVRFIDAENNKKYVFHPESDSILVSHHSQTPESTAGTFYLDEMLDNMLRELGMSQQEMTVEQGEYEGIDVDIYKTQLAKTNLGGIELTGESQLIADRNTHLPSYAKCLGYAPDGTLMLEVTLTFDYPPEAPADIYALGVPESAQVQILDGYATPEAAAVLDRLDKRASQGIGNHVAIVAVSVLTEDKSLRKRTVKLYAQSNGTSLLATYKLDAQDSSLFPSWPVPDVTAVLEYARSHPNAGRVFGTNNAASPNGTLSGLIWPGRHRLEFGRKDHDVSGKVILLENNDRPQHIGLHANQILWDGIRCDITYWIDPQRDDLCVEEISRNNIGDDRQHFGRSHTKYLDYAQLDDGRWYPTHWQLTVSDESSGDAVCTLDYRLAIYPDMTLDDWWFTIFPNQRIEQ